MFLPSSTYRIQLHKDFTLSDFTNILEYLEVLGVDTIYAAPILKATPGSMHGYDVIDPHEINPEIGTLSGLEEIAGNLKSKDMHWLQDIVPNHMAFTTHNSRLMDVLERGKYSPYYNYFDINWNHPNQALNGKLMIPVLGKELNQCIDDREIKIMLSASGICVAYFDNQYPVSVDTYDFLLTQMPGDGMQELRANLDAYKMQLLREIDFLKWREYKEKWLKSFTENKALSSDFSNLIHEVNHNSAKLSEILDQQGYRLMFWKQTESIINYRRFFTVNSLICLRMEAEEVFDEYHKFIASLYHKGLIHGVRVDHIDGLNDPSRYLKRLRKLLGEDCYIIAEKILEAKEEMPEHWPLEGTSGYEFLSYVNQLFTDKKGADDLASFYHSLLPGMPDYEEIVLLNKRLILNSHMAGELENLVTYFFELNLQGNFQKDGIKEALSLFMLSFPVYRIYPGKLPLKGNDLEFINEAFAKAHILNPVYKEELDYIHSLCVTQHQEDPQAESIILFIRRLMQFTGPLTAKGVEDTTFYIYNPLISHEEVGDAPSTLGITIQEFHMRMIRRQQSTPFSLNATSTHDTKRGEDARIRLNAISEIPQEWMQKVREWVDINKEYKKLVSNQAAPILNDEYFIYQSILGGFPEDQVVNESWIERLKQYMVKVVREAKVMSSWESPNLGYEQACQSFLESILKEGSLFLQNFIPFFKGLLPIANTYSVAQAVIKITAPGIPDIYQGCDLLDLSYVDPDNRRPVDYAKRKDFLERILDKEKEGWNEIIPYLREHANEGVMKLFATWKSLNFRKRSGKLFTHGAYLPITLTGHGRIAVAFARYYGDDWCIVVIPLGIARKKQPIARELTDICISLPANSPREWRNIFTDEPIVTSQDQISVGELVKDFPVAVLRSN
jgi:(1->4)-alpha-D-glucan 1-alpha-D-glucosylmutase